MPRRSWNGSASGMRASSPATPARSATSTAWASTFHCSPGGASSEPRGGVRATFPAGRAGGSGAAPAVTGIIRAQGRDQGAPVDVKALQARLAAFAAERGWDELHNPRNLAIALAGEAGMLLDLFRWLNDAQSQRIESEYKREAAEEAIADLVLHTLRLADKLGVDVERAVAKKLAENDANYPLPTEEAVASPPASAV